MKSTANYKPLFYFVSSTRKISLTKHSGKYPKGHQKLGTWRSLSACLSSQASWLRTLCLHASLVHFVLLEWFIGKSLFIPVNLSTRAEYKARKSRLRFKTWCPSTVASLWGFQGLLQTYCWSVTSLQGAGLDFQPLKGQNNCHNDCFTFKSRGIVSQQNLAFWKH